MLTILLSGCAFGLVSGIEDQAVPPDELPATEVDLKGRTYAIAAEALSITDPPGLDGMKDDFLSRKLLVFVAAEDQDALELRITLAAPDGRQDPCEKVRAFPIADFSQDPLFSVEGGELTTSFGGGHPATFRELALSGVFDPDALAWHDGTMDAMLDARELEPALPEGTDVCELVDGLGGACEACDDGEDLCFHLGIEGIRAQQIEMDFDEDPSSRCNR